MVFAGTEGRDGSVRGLCTNIVPGILGISLGLSTYSRYGRYISINFTTILRICWRHEVGPFGNEVTERDSCWHYVRVGGML